uniref:MRH domain-containing protein n=1 Tax=Trichuris muris TaxID=70415 RepID=A0A5S6R399_TRIMR
MAHRLKDLSIRVSLVAVCVALMKSTDSALRECKEGDFHFEYTECDKHGGRWRVSVPRTDECQGGHPPPPVRGRDCSFSCRPGTFLDLSSQECKPCPPGTYSLGGGIRYDDFPTGKHLPQGFRVVNEFISLASLQAGIPAGDVEENTEQTMDNCESSGWQIRGNAITYIPSRCLSTLMYSVKLVRPGFVKYKYLYPDGGIFFAFQVQNDQCINVNDGNLGKHTFPQPTTETSWKEEKVVLASGQLLLSWKAMVLHGQHRPIKIKGIEIRGIAYAQECSPCANGTFSQGNSGYCQPCPPNTYSGMEAGKCVPCDNRTQFSGARASKCEPRPPCTVSDYYSLRGPCNWNKKSIIQYRWSEPKICRDDVPGSVLLPPPRQDADCPPCNPGTYMVDGRCHICPVGHYSSGIGECQLCPVNTAPERGYTFIWWNELPDKIGSSCQTMDQGNCDVHEGWLPLGDRISTSRSRRSDLYLTLSLQVLGYKSTSPPSTVSSTGPVGTVSFVFDTTCAGDCGFYFIEVSTSTGRPTILSEWNGTLPKQSMKYPVMKPNGTVYQWVFIKSQTNGDVSIDQASIYAINVTNTVDGGAAGCIPCPVNMKTHECIPCPSGHYIQNITGACVPCPKGTFLKGLSNEGIKACAECGLNTHSVDGTECTVQCLLKINSSTFDLRPLKGLFQAKGVEIFSREGSSYFHMFNISVCDAPKAVCNDTMQEHNKQETPIVSSAICKVTSLPTVNETLFVNPLGLGDRLLAVSDNATFNGIRLPKGAMETWQFPQIYFLYQSLAISRACGGGYHTIVVFRCDPTTKVARATLPTACPDGTCDGCLYQVVITSRYACPICSQQDYKEIVGECTGGTQKIHRIPARHCILIGKDLTETRTVECSEVSIQMQATIGAATAIGAVLFVVVLLIWKKNQRLEYKYMKLVETSTGKDDNLSAAESCALNEGEEDTAGPMVDKIVFLKSKPRTRSDKRRKEEWDNYENVALAASSDGNFST